MPKTFINSDLKHFWKCQGWGGQKKWGKILQQYSCTDYVKNYDQNFSDNANIGAGIGYIGLGFIGSLILPK
jgi:hypothetical protein